MNSKHTLKKELLNHAPTESEYGRHVPNNEAALKQGTWLTTNLYNYYDWKGILTAAGGTWQDLMGAFGRYAVPKAFKEYKLGTRKWGSAMGILVDVLVDDVMKR